MNGKRVCLVPKLRGIGGPVSFQQKLAAGFAMRGVGVCYEVQDSSCGALLVTGGTRQLAQLWRARRRGVPVVQRLDGMNWLHRVRRTGVKHFLRAEYGNLILRIIRDRLADRVVYQSRFAQDWWKRAFGAAPAPEQVIYNGVDLEIFSPGCRAGRLADLPHDRYRLLMVEGNLGGGYEVGLETGVRLAEELSRGLGKPLQLVVVGRSAKALQDTWQAQAGVELVFTGPVPQERIPEYDRSAHLFFSADLHAACPNSVIEALACGLPVVAYDTGALPELVQEGAGRVAPYGGDAWRLDPPDLQALAQAAREILADLERFRMAARRRAEQAFGLDQMVDAYLQVLLPGEQVRREGRE